MWIVLLCIVVQSWQIGSRVWVIWVTGTGHVGRFCGAEGGHVCWSFKVTFVGQVGHCCGAMWVTVVGELDHRCGAMWVTCVGHVSWVIWVTLRGMWGNCVWGNVGHVVGRGGNCSG